MPVTVTMALEVCPISVGEHRAGLPVRKSIATVSRRPGWCGSNAQPCSRPRNTPSTKPIMSDSVIVDGRPFPSACRSSGQGSCKGTISCGFTEASTLELLVMIW